MSTNKTSDADKLFMWSKIQRLQSEADNNRELQILRDARIGVGRKDKMFPG